jgi:hypothetical protein
MDPDCPNDPLVGTVHFVKQSFVPLSIDVPMLHGVRHIRGLDEMLNHNCCLAVGIFGSRVSYLCRRLGFRRKGLVPPGFSFGT